MNFLDLLVGNQSTSTSVGITEESLIAEEAEVRREVDRLQGDIGAQRTAQGEALRAINDQEQSAQKTLEALINNNTAQANRAISEYRQQQDRLGEQDRIASQVAEAYGLQAQLDQLRPDFAEMREVEDHYRDKLAQTKLETIDTKNPFKWAWNALVEQPYYEKRVQEARQQVLDQVGTTARVFSGANHTQQVANSFTAKVDSGSVQADNYNAIQAAAAAADAVQTTQYFTDRSAAFGAKYNFRKDVADQQNQYVSTIAGLYTGKRAARAASARGADDMLDALTKYGELVEKGLAPDQLAFFENSGIDIGRALTMPKAARGALFSHLSTAGAIPLVFTPKGTKEEDIAGLLQAGLQSAPALPDPIAADFTTKIYREAADEFARVRSMSGLSANDAKKELEKLRFITTEVDPLGKITITGVNFKDALDTPVNFGGVGEAAGTRGPRTVTQIYAQDSLTRPGSVLGKTALASSSVQALIAQNKPGAKLAKELRARVDGQTEDGIPEVPAAHVMTFKEIAQLANNDPREIYGFYQAIQESVQMRLPYAALGATPTTVLPEFYGEFLEPGILSDTPKAWSLPVRSVEDVNEFLIQSQTRDKIYEQTKKLQNERYQASPFSPNNNLPYGAQ